MTVKEKLEQKIKELEEIKAKLLKLSQFTDPSNDTRVYSSKSIKDLNNTQGVTPKNFGEVLTVVIKKLNEYSDYINSLNYVIGSSVNRSRIVTNYKIVPEIADVSNIPQEFSLKYENVDFQSLLNYVPDAEYTSPVTSMSITGTPVIRKDSSSGDPVDIGAVFLHLNPRMMIKDKIVFNNGIISANVSPSSFFGDDIFVVGVFFREDISPDQVFYIDLSYRVDLQLVDGRTVTKAYSIANKKIGVEKNVFDTLRQGIVIAWDMLAVNRCDFTIHNTQGDDTNIGTAIDRPIGGGTFDGNVISQITVQGISQDIANYLLSYRDSCAYYRGIYDCKYSLYSVDEDSLTPVMIPNLKPINEVIYEALRDL